MSVKKQALRLLTRGLLLAGRYVSPRLAVRVGSVVARRLPLDPRFNRRKLVENLRFYFPDRDASWARATAASIQAMAARARMFDKYFLPSIPLEELDSTCIPVGWDELERAWADGRGVIIVSIHYGRYWAAPVWCSRHGKLASAFQSAEGRLPAKGATLSGESFNVNRPRTAALRAVRALRAGHTVFQLLDTGKLETPVVVDFLGHPTMMSASCVRLARASGALVFPSLAPTDPSDDDRIALTIYDAIDPSALPEDEPLEVTMRRILRPIEEQVRRDPSQWFSAHTAHLRLAEGEGAPSLAV